MLDGIPFEKLTAPVLVGIAVLLLLIGRLVPRSSLMDVAKERDQWRLAYEASEKARAASDAQTAELLELAKTTHNIIVAMFDATDYAKRSGGARVVPTGQ